MIFFFFNNYSNTTLAREAVIKSLGVIKLPGVEHLKTVLVLGDMHVLPLTLRSTAQAVNLSPNPIPLPTHNTIPLYIYKYRAVFHFKFPPGGPCPTYISI